jgi:hypothetical protein
LPDDAFEKIVGAQAIGFERGSIAKAFVDSPSEGKIAGQEC